MQTIFSVSRIIPDPEIGLNQTFLSVIKNIQTIFSVFKELKTDKGRKQIMFSVSRIKPGERTDTNHLPIAVPSYKKIHLQG